MARIIFVDDEPLILDSLRQSLRKKRKVWEMEFVASGIVALERMQQVSFDIIVSDMRMPGMDGADLLSRAAVVQPQAARLILSGQMDDVAATRAATVAHRFLLKPCDHEVLESTIVRTLALNSRLNSERLKSCISSMAALPSLPKACLELNQAIRVDRTPIHRVAQIIETDVGMSTKVLQLVNSSFFGANSRVSSIAQAVNYIGLKTICHLVLAESMFKEFCGADLESFERAQSRLLLCAQIAPKLVADKRQAESAATAALLHDVGMLVMADRLPDEDKLNRDLAMSRGIPLHEAESEQLGTTHAEIGAYLLGLWGLPHDIIDAVANHHAPLSTVESMDVSTSVRLADALACSLLAGENECGLYGVSPPAELLERFNVPDIIRQMGYEIQT